MWTKRHVAVLAAVALAGGLAGGISGGLTGRGDVLAGNEPRTKIIRAERIELVDASGKARAWLEMDGDGNPGLFLAKENCIMASFSLVGNGTPRLDLGDECNVRAVIRLDAGGNPALTFYDREKKVVWSAP